MSAEAAQVNPVYPDSWAHYTTILKTQFWSSLLHSNKLLNSGSELIVVISAQKRYVFKENKELSLKVILYVSTLSYKCLAKKLDLLSTSKSTTKKAISKGIRD